jgi:hypothetical protein
VIAGVMLVSAVLPIIVRPPRGMAKAAEVMPIRPEKAA